MNKKSLLVMLFVFGLCYCFGQDEKTVEEEIINIEKFDLNKDLQDTFPKKPASPTWKLGMLGSFSYVYDYHLIFRPSFGLGYGFVYDRHDDPGNAGWGRLSVGPILQISPGVSGGKISLGFGASQAIVVGGYLKASFLRTWNDPHILDNNSNYFGPEIEINVLLFNFSIGYFKKLDGSHLESGGEINFSVGLGMTF